MNGNEFENILKEMQEEVKRQDVEMKRRGMTHRITFWHHKPSGDDEQGDIYLGGDPSNMLNQVKGWPLKDIRAAKRGAKHRSTKQILDIAIKSKGDYQIITL